MKNISWKKLLFIAGIVLFVIFGVYFITRPSEVKTPTATSTPITKAAEATPPVAQTPTSSQEARLVYLIEEEKLAHDVYVKLYEKWQSPVFGNIIESETSHQNQVLALLKSKNIADPRSSEVGVFTDAKLQDLYNQLVAKGLQNLEDAYKAGVTIEELDIADLTSDLAVTTDTSEIAVLESLRNGSENHLRAFNRQLDRIQ